MGRALTWPLAHASAAPRSSFASILQPSIIERPSLHRTLLLLRISASTEVAWGNFLSLDCQNTDFSSLLRGSVRPQANSNKLHPWSTWTRYNHFVTHIFVLVRSTQRVRLGLKPATRIVNGELGIQPPLIRDATDLNAACGFPKPRRPRQFKPVFAALVRSAACQTHYGYTCASGAPSLAFFKVSRSVANEYPFRVLFKSKTSRTVRREQRLPNPQPLRSPFEKQDPIVLHHGGKPIPLDVHPQPPEKLANDAQHQIRQSKPFLSQTSRDIPSPCCQTFLS
ncbi:hypothetical protein CMEL01_15310 [Colletotrichum melonis]|uniref:Uncharacterized protein n=1 Tax=Colletotrichum melonis TaxID=1209925 RepID=A0AAI9UM33_9PEZI|nr:hypothetical protein CMEL01_15310 [Colletotrichum melonis]